MSPAEEEERVVQALITSARILLARPGEVIDPGASIKSGGVGNVVVPKSPIRRSSQDSEGEEEEERDEEEEEGGWHEALPRQPAGTYMVLYGEGDVYPWREPEEKKDDMFEEEPPTPSSPSKSPSSVAVPASKKNFVAVPASKKNFVAVPASKKNFAAVPASKKNFAAVPASKKKIFGATSTAGSFNGGATGRSFRNPKKSGPPGGLETIASLEKVVVIEPTRRVKAGDIFTLTSLPDSANAVVQNSASEVEVVDGDGPGKPLILIALPVLGAHDPNVAALVRWREAESSPTHSPPHSPLARIPPYLHSTHTVSKAPLTTNV